MCNIYNSHIQMGMPYKQFWWKTGWNGIQSPKRTWPEEWFQCTQQPGQRWARRMTQRMGRAPPSRLEGRASLSRGRRIEKRVETFKFLCYPEKCKSCNLYSSTSRGSTPAVNPPGSQGCFRASCWTPGNGAIGLEPRPAREPEAEPGAGGAAGPQLWGVRSGWSGRVRWGGCRQCNI